MNNGNTKRAVLVVVAILAALVLIVLGGVALYINYLMDLVTRNDPSQSSGMFSSGIWETPGSTGPTSASSGVGNIEQPTEVINIMLLGQDDRDGAVYGRTDTMVICSVNPKTKKITMTSILRDLWVTIPGKWDDRMNAAYAYGGFDLLRETVKFNFGVEIDNFILVEFSSFSAVVDILGGVNIDLTQDEVEWLNKNYGWELTAGPNWLDGQKTLAYSRIRKIDDDFHRVQRQHKVLQTIFAAYKSKPLLELLDVTEQILPHLTVTMSKQELVSYIARMAPMLSGFEIESHRIPANGTWWFQVINGNDIIMADLDENRDILAEILTH